MPPGGRALGAARAERRAREAALRSLENRVGYLRAEEARAQAKIEDLRRQTAEALERRARKERAQRAYQAEVARVQAEREREARAAREHVRGGAGAPRDRAPGREEPPAGGPAGGDAKEAEAGEGEGDEEVFVIQEFGAGAWTR